MVKAQLQGECARTYVVQQGDYCASVAVSQKVPTYVIPFYPFMFFVILTFYADTNY